MFKPLYTLFYRKYWFDELYEGVIVRLALLKGLFAGFQLFDSYGVDGAATGPEGLRKALSGRFDLVLLDIMLPGIDGYEICDRVRAQDLSNRSSC